MSDFLDKLNGPQTVAMIAIIMGGLIGLFAVGAALIMPFWARVRRTEAEVSLKRTLIARGASIDEIERVVRATAGR